MAFYNESINISSLPYVFLASANSSINSLPVFILLPNENDSTAMQSNFLSTNFNQQQNEPITENIGDRQHPFFLVELILILLGLFGNTLTAAIIICSKLIKSNANKYICIMVLADSVYLLSSLGDLFHSRTHSFWLCAAQEMLANSSAYISSMCIVLLTIERFLAIVCPLEHMQTAEMNRWLIVFGAVLPLLIWHFSMMLISLESTEANVYDMVVFKCAYYEKMPFAGLSTIVSNSFHYLLPLICVTFLNVIIALKVKFSSGTKFLKGSSNPQTSSIEMGSTSTSAQPSSSRSGGSSSVPLVLFVIPLVYVLLNTPFYTVRFLTSALSSIDGIQFEVPIFVEWASYYAYMSNYASNALEYAIASSSFRQRIIVLWRRPFRKLRGITNRSTLNSSNQRTQSTSQTATSIRGKH